MIIINDTNRLSDGTVREYVENNFDKLYSSNTGSATVSCPVGYIDMTMDTEVYDVDNGVRNQIVITVTFRHANFGSLD